MVRRLPIWAGRGEKPRRGTHECGRHLALLILMTAAAGFAADRQVDLGLIDLGGKEVHLKYYRDRIVVLNFWATWCGPCRDEMPMISEVEKEWRDKGVVFIGVSVDEKNTRLHIPAFVDRYKITFPIWTGANGDDVAALGLGNAVPGTAFLNKDGIIVARIQGQMRRDELEERLIWLTGDQKGTPPEPLVRHLTR
jgi:thiol-disulfide isomerase/thioredoxin